MSSILNSKEWKLIEGRFPLVEKELASFRASLEALEQAPKLEVIDSLGEPCSVKESIERIEQAKVARKEMLRPKEWSREATEKAMRQLIAMVRPDRPAAKEHLVHRRTIPAFVKDNPHHKSTIYCSVYYNEKDRAYIYRDENGFDVAMRFARSGEVVELIDMRNRVCLPCPWCGIHSAPKNNAHPVVPFYGFVGHAAKNGLATIASDTGAPKFNMDW